MTEQQFLTECERVLHALEESLDQSDLDIDTRRSDLVLTIEFEGGAKVIVNGNTPLREIWLAARSGGFHFKQVDGRWLDTRSGRELFESISGCVTEAAGSTVTLSDRPA